MPRTHKPYDEEFRCRSVELLLESGKPLTQLARELGVSAESLREWKKRHDTALAQVDAGNGKNALDLQGENKALRKELDYVRRQRDILKKAVAICSQWPENLNVSHS